MNQNQIIENLEKLNVSYSGNFENGWLSILCPFHPKPDRHFGNCFISENSVIKCFSCGAISNLFGAVKLKFPTLSNKEIFDFLGNENISLFNSNLKKRLEERKQEQNKIERIYRIDWDKLSKIPVDLNLYYCKTRNFTKEWIDLHSITIINSGYYEGYFCIPIVFQSKTVSFEFRKALEYERLRKVFRAKESPLESLRDRFKALNTKDEYLSKPKTLYPKGHKELKKTIFNYDNLDFDKDLYICEGIAGTADLFSKGIYNCTATYGVNISEEQIELLRKFNKRKYIISDNDSASEVYIWNLSQSLDNVFVEEELASLYLLRRSGFMDFKIK